MTVKGSRFLGNEVSAYTLPIFHIVAAARDDRLVNQVAGMTTLLQIFRAECSTEKNSVNLMFRCSVVYVFELTM